MQFWVVKQLDAGVQFVNRELLRLESITNIVVALSALSGLFLLVIFVLWLYRAYANMEKLDRNIDAPRLMLIFGWIIPIYNMIVPFRWIDKLNYSTYFQLRRMQVQGGKLVSSNLLLLGWIAVIIASFIRGYMQKRSVDMEYDTLMQLGIAKEFCVLTGILVMSYFISNYRKLEHKLYTASLEEPQDEDESIAEVIE